MGIEVRRVRPDEYDVAGEMTASAYQEFGPKTAANHRVRSDDDWEAYLIANRDVRGRDAIAPVFVAVDPDTDDILGTLTLETEKRTNPEARPLEPDEAYIRMLGVAPSARGRGAGRALMAHAIEQTRAAGRSRITLNTTM